MLDQIDYAIHEGNCWRFSANLVRKIDVARCLTGLTAPTSGRVMAYDKVLDGINPYASLFPDFCSLPWLTVEQNVAVGLMSKLLSRAKKAASRRQSI